MIKIWTTADLEDLKDLTEQMEFWVNGVALTVTSISGIISMFLVWPDIFFSFHNHTLHIELQIIIFALSCFEETLWQLFFYKTGSDKYIDYIYIDV